MTNEQLTEAIIKTLSNISRNEALELIYELAKNYRTRRKLSPFHVQFFRQSFLAVPIHLHPILQGQRIAYF